MQGQLLWFNPDRVKMRYLAVLLLSGAFLSMASGASALEMLLNYPLHEVLEADLSPRGLLLATAHPGNFIEVRSLNPLYLDGRLYSEKRDKIEALRFIDELKLLAIREESIELWERKDIRRWSLELKANRERSSPIACGKNLIAFMPSEEEIEIYDLKGKKKIMRIREPLYDIKGLSFSRDEETLFLILRSGKILAYQVKEGSEAMELGKIKDYIDIEEGRALILEGKRVKIVDIGSSTTLHELKLKGRWEKGFLRGDNLLLLSKDGALLLKLRDGAYSIEREFKAFKDERFKLHEKGVLSWKEEGVALNEKTLLQRDEPLKVEGLSIEGEKLAQIGKGFAVVWDLRSFLPELFFEGEAFLKDGKLYLRDKGRYISYDLKSGESTEFKDGDEKEDLTLSDENLLLKKDGLYDLKRRERILDLRDKRFFLFRKVGYLVVLERDGVFLYKLRGKVGKKLKVSFKEAFKDEERGLIALIHPDGLSLTLLKVQDESERDIDGEEVGEIKEVAFFDEVILVAGNKGFSLFNDKGEKIRFEERGGIMKVIKVDEDRALISRTDGTLWLYSIKRGKPIVYHDLNGIVKSALLKDGKIFALLETGELYVLPSNNLRPWLCFLLFSRDDWIIISSGNYFNSSLKGQSRVLWLDGKNIYAGERFNEKYKGSSKLRGIWNEL